MKCSKLFAVIMSFALVLPMAACGQKPAETPGEVVDVESQPAEVESPSGGEVAAESINGKFEGVGYGMQGEVRVEIAVVDNKITEISFLENPETLHVARVAIERIPAQIIENQSLSVDTVTGATLTSRAIMLAVTDAAKNAKLDVSALTANKVTAKPGPDETLNTDVLVLGGGGAGFSAAITAAQQGVKVVLLEKSSVLGGNTMMAGSAFNAVDVEAQKGMILGKAQKAALDSYLALDENSPDLKFDVFPEWKEVLVTLKKNITDFYNENQGKTAGEDMPGFDSVALHMWHIYIGGLRQLETGDWIASDIDLARTMAESALGTFEWMDEIGMETVYGEGVTLSTVLGAMWPRTHDFLHGDARITQLEAFAKSCGVDIYTETAGTELIVSGNKVVGAIATKADGTKVTINTTKGVVLATGGYCANPAMVKQYDQYWGDNLSANTLSTNLGTNEGDGIVMASKVGAALTGMGVAQMMPSSSPTKGTMTDGVWADAATQIWVDGNGNRFVNEYAERDVLAKASLALDKGIFYIIYSGMSNPNDPSQMAKGVSFDEQTYFGDKISDMVRKGHIWYGETLADLAEASKTAAAGATPAFTEESLRNTIEKYNSYVASQKDDDFGKDVIAGAVDLEYIEATDGVGICITPRKASLHHTMGGVVIDTEARVLDNNGNVIEGLWAAGEVTGGVHAGNRLGGNAIADIFTYGRIAGASAAK